MVPSCACSYQHSTECSKGHTFRVLSETCSPQYPVLCTAATTVSQIFPPLNSRRPLDPAWVLFPVLHLVSCLKAINYRDFPGGLMVKTPCFQCRGHRFDPWLENYMPCGTVKKKKKTTKKTTTIVKTLLIHSLSLRITACHARFQGS